MPVDINRLTEGWLELESDPGLFTLLLEDFGVKGVQVEEIYDLQKSLEGPVYGFIFLFRWIEERRSRRKVVDQSETFVKDEEVVNNIFFAQQMVPNSCATHALLSVLLNCPNIHLGATLSRLKAHTSGMCPENKGWAIGNTPELAKAHNSHAMPQAKRRLDKSSGVSTGRYTGEAFHFVSYVPIHGKLFELDGLKPFPMDHGPWGEKEDWTEKFRRVITDRLGIATGEQYHDIRFNLMAVVPDRRLALDHKLKMLKTNRQIVLEALQQLVKLTHPDLTEKDGTQNSDEKKETDTPNTENMKKETSKICTQKVKINGIMIDPEERKIKKEPMEHEPCNVSNSILEAHNYAKIKVDHSSNTTKPEKVIGDDSDKEQSSAPIRLSCNISTQESTEENRSRELITTKAHTEIHSLTNAHDASNGKMLPSSVESPPNTCSQLHNVNQESSQVSTGCQSHTSKLSSESSVISSSTTQISVSCITNSSIVGGIAITPVPAAPASVSAMSPTVTNTTPAIHSPVITHSISTSHTPSVQPQLPPPSSVSGHSVTTSNQVNSLSLLSPPGPPDYSTPLTIQTSPAPSTSSTDTSSEVGSAFNSPTQGWGWNSGQSSPTSTKDFKKFVVIRVAGSGEEKVDSPSARISSTVNTNGKRFSADVTNTSKRVCLENGQKVWEKDIDKSGTVNRENSTAPLLPKGFNAENEGNTVTEEKKPDTKICSKYPELFEPHTFAPKDLLALLKNLENEISVCEMNLRDENEKRKKYKIDDCRRTHNYDEFICTFLSMLAQQGKLADLVQQHLLLKKPGLPVPRVQRPAKKVETRPSPSRRRRGRTKYRKRK